MKCRPQEAWRHSDIEIATRKPHEVLEPCHRPCTQRCATRALPPTAPVGRAILLSPKQQGIKLRRCVQHAPWRTYLFLWRRAPPPNPCPPAHPGRCSCFPNPTHMQQGWKHGCTLKVQQFQWQAPLHAVGLAAAASAASTPRPVCTAAQPGRWRLWLCRSQLSPSTSRHLSAGIAAGPSSAPTAVHFGVAAGACSGLCGSSLARPASRLVPVTPGGGKLAGLQTALVHLLVPKKPHYGSDSLTAHWQARQLRNRPCTPAPFLSIPLPAQVGPSKVAGRGVFALLHIEAGTVIGSYPGRPRTPVGCVDGPA